MTLLQGLALLLLCQSAGEVLVRLSGAPLPAPVLGAGLLLGLLRWSALRAPVAMAADGLLGHLSLLFVPVGVGVITHGALLSEFGGRMLVAIVVSTWIGLAITALVMRRLLKGD
ncbi:CidA/LrgA family protein [Ideonella sp. 4Y11]|uniref:CidA/LrgA family protein n=1 Tax=Ideonella aquatica TaxID=2824119 RepID=A0A941BLC4_9BURK|nr:CidA/LrgA family protein [Ideonella aquatica]MBQ0961287.1 CidA/LrgA family protein [Ideonella aquatica]